MRKQFSWIIFILSLIACEAKSPQTFTVGVINTNIPILFTPSSNPDQIFNETLPADLPVGTAGFELTINLQTAVSLNLDIPDDILERSGQYHSLAEDYFMRGV